MALESNSLALWNDGDAKQAIVDFVERVTTPGSPDFVNESERIATFDNDGTLWSEQPLYFQIAFAMERAWPIWLRSTRNGRRLSHSPQFCLAI